jgi:hypothetical protein
VIQEHSLAWTQGQAADWRTRHRRLMLVAIVFDALLGLAAVLGPVTMARLLGGPEPFPDGWMQGWGLLLIATSLLCLPGRKDPVLNRWPNWLGIVVRLAMAVLFLAQGQGFRLLALWEALAAILLLISYYRLLQAELLRRP